MAQQAITKVRSQNVFCLCDLVLESNCEPPGPHCQCFLNIPVSYVTHDTTYTHIIITLCRRAVYRLNLFVLWGTHSLLSPGCSFYRAVSVNLVK